LVSKLRKAENFILKDQKGTDFELYKNLKNNILLVFYPKNNSFVCSRQLRNYSTSIEKFEKSRIRLIGINDGSPEEHFLFCRSQELNITLLSDPELVVIKQFGALYPFKLIKRKLVLINKNAEIIFDKNLPQYSYWDHDKLLSFLVKNEIIY
jgi:thioredoxin-dependent peroxiredoxin